MPEVVSAVTVVVSEEADVIVAAGPLTCVQAPAPTVAAFAVIVTEPVVVQTD